MTPHGIHHLTAVTAQVGRNHQFYTETLGLRLVKKTVNQDDVSAYHLFYADGQGSPGTDLTFFDWPVERERRGTHSIIRTGLRVANEPALQWWLSHLQQANVPHSEILQRDNRRVIDFEDFEGQRLSLVEDETAPSGHPWSRSTVPVEHQIRGLGPIVISVPRLEPTDRVLTSILGLSQTRTYISVGADEPEETTIHVYQMDGDGPAAELHVAVEPRLRPAQAGAGGVHHVAFRTTRAQYPAWVERLKEMGVPNSGPVSRFYFQSLYFREPNGILFEIATDEPGFTADEPLESLGEKLALPPFLEGRRSEIERRLKPLTPPTSSG
jgi:glyoxalase family protein